MININMPRVSHHIHDPRGPVLGHVLCTIASVRMMEGEYGNATVLGSIFALTDEAKGTA